MVIHDRGYQRWDGDKRAPVRGVSVILDRGVTTALAGLFRKKLFAQLLSFAAYGPFLFGLGVMYLHFFFSSHPELSRVAADMEQSGLLDEVTPNADTVWGYLFIVQKWFGLVLCVLVGSGLIAEDRRTNALELYLSRPLRLRDYVLGKLAVIGFFLAMVTIVPCMILVVVHSLLHGVGPGEADLQLGLLWRAPLAGGVEILMAAMLVLAASSLAQRARNAAILFIGGLAVVEGVIAGLLQEVFRDSTFKLVSIDFNVGQVMAWILDNVEEFDPEVSVVQSWLVLGFWLILATTVILRRVRPVEVVA
jgi:ABC-type transport system involved in multi-copper enzyme maturation permease subunit